MIYAARCGAKLLEVKAGLDHGQWMPWLDENFQGSNDKAGRYMRLAKEMPELLEANSATSRNLPSVHQALSLITADEETKAIVQEKLEAKAGVEHGEWAELLKANCKVKRTQAQKYMNLAKEVPELLNPNYQSTGNLLGIEHAAALLTADEEINHVVQEKLEAGESVTVKEIERP